LNTPDRHVLYIDDDEGIRRLVSKALQRRGFQVSLASSGAEGVAMTQGQAQDQIRAFDLIAVDHYMPGQDGLATLAALRELPDCPPVVYVTGSEESRIAVAALKSGADDYVVKAVGDDFFDLLAKTFTQVLGRADLRRERDRAEEELRVTNARLEALLKEVNHRVANNLQMVMAFVGMQANSLTDEAARDALQRTQLRIATVAEVNRRLYTKDDVEFVALDEYLGGLGEDLSSTWSTSGAARDVLVEIAPIRLRTDKAITLGMIMNELVSNACKYAYDRTEPGEVRLALRQISDERIELVVEDDGVGRPADGVVRGTGLGTRLIATLARSHNADIAYEDVAPQGARRGTRATVSVPLKQDDLRTG